MSGHTLNRQQAADHLGVSVKTLSRYVKKHSLPYKKVMGRNNRFEYRFSAEELDTWSHVRQRVEYNGLGQEVEGGRDRTVYKDTEITGKGQNRTGQKAGHVKEIDGDGKGKGSGTEDKVLSLLIESYQQQIATLESQLSALQEQLAQKDSQIDKLQGNYDNIMQMFQAQMNRLVYDPATLEKTTPKKAKKQSPEQLVVMDRIRKLREEGLSYKKIAKKLNAQATPTFSGRGKWQAGTVQKLVQKKSG